jgi:DNA-binding transcriptional regulator LsrR (DeoR family)
MTSRVADGDLERWRYPPAQLHAAARLYYLEDATQAEVAERLGTSRATVSRMLDEARRAGIARIEVVAPRDDEIQELSAAAATALGLERIHLITPPPALSVGEGLGPVLSEALAASGLRAGDILLVSSGRTVHEATLARLPLLPGVVVAPTIGGQDELEAWYAPNEITRRMAERLGGTPVFLYAPALPTARLHDALTEDPSYRRVIELWKAARCAIVGIGAPPLSRTSLPRFVPDDTASLRHAVGDVCSRFYDRRGQPVAFAGSERLIAVELEALQAIPNVIGIAAGAVKLDAIRAAAGAGYITQLVTDTDTARRLLKA